MVSKPVDCRPGGAPAYPDPGVVDQRVDRAVRLDLVGEPAHLVKLREIPGDKRRIAAELLQYRTTSLVAARVDQHSMAVGE